MMKKEPEKSTPTWKDMFLFTRDGRLQSMDLMYAFFLGLGGLFLNFIVSNRLTIAVEALFPAMSRSGKNALGIAVPAVICGLLAALLFRIIRKKKITVMAYFFALLLVILIFVIILFQFDREMTELILPAFIGIFLIPAAVCAVTTALLFKNWLKLNPDPLRDEKAAPDPEPEEEKPESDEPDYSGWRQFR